MVPGALRTLALRPPMPTRYAVPDRRMTSYPANAARFPANFQAAVFPPPLFGGYRGASQCLRASSGSDQADESANKHARDLTFSKPFSWTRSFLDFTASNFLPLGLAIFCCMPTTLSSGVALTQLVGGNSALALAMTVISNLLGILLVPFSLSKFIGAGAGVSVPTLQLLKSLVSTLLVPLVLGKVMRDAFNGVSEYVDQNRHLFSMMSSIFLSLVPWIQVSRSRSLLLTVRPAIFAIAISMGTVLHFTLLALNSLAVWSLSVFCGDSRSVFAKKENARAVVIVASQKTLPVMVAVVEPLGGALGEPGLLVLPCVASHINQIIIDSFLVNCWLRKDQLSIECEEVKGVNQK